MAKKSILGVFTLALLCAFSACSSSKENAEMDELAKTYCGCMQQVIDMKYQKPKNEADTAAMTKWKSETADAMIAASECTAQRVDTLMKAADIKLQQKYGESNSDAYREAMGKSHEAFIVGLKKHCPDMYKMFSTDDSNIPKQSL